MIINWLLSCVHHINLGRKHHYHDHHHCCCNHKIWPSSWEPPPWQCRGSTEERHLMEVQQWTSVNTHRLPRSAFFCHWIRTDYHGCCCVFFVFLNLREIQKQTLKNLQFFNLTNSTVEKNNFFAFTWGVPKVMYSGMVKFSTSISP